MSKDITTAGPSRRQIAKGAAWAVPAVSVAAAAPALAASPLPVCTTATVAPNCPGIIDTDTLFFTISNPAGSGCVIPAGTPITISHGGLAGVDAALLNGIALNADVLFTSATQGETTRAIQPDDSLDVYIFPPSLVNLAVLRTASVSILGATATQRYTLATVAGLTVAVCGLG